MMEEKFMTKRIITFILSITVVLGCMSMSTYAASNNYTIENETLELMQILGIIDDGDIEAANDNITRGKAASIFATFFPDDVIHTNAYFEDVTEIEECYEAVARLVDNGVVAKADVYRPDDYVTLEEFIKLAVSVTGYGEWASLGGYPDGYMKIAREKNILDGVYTNENGFLNLYQAARIIINVLECDADYFTFKTSKQNSEGKNILERCFDVYESKGVVSDNGITSLSGGSNINVNQVQIDANIYNISEEDNRWLGYDVKAYYRYDDERDERNILLISPISNRNDVVEVPYYDITYSNGIYRYQADNRVKNINVQNGTIIIYNGKAVSSQDYMNGTFPMVPTYGTVKFISYSSSRDADVIFINDYRSLMVYNYSEQEETINGLASNSISLKDKDYRIFDTNGNAVILDTAVKHKTSLLAAESLDNKYVEILASTSVVNGTVEDIDNDENVITYRINDGLYNAVPGFHKEIKLGSSGDFYVDALGGIVDFYAEGASSKIYGYVIKVYSGDTFALRLYSQYDTMNTLNLAEKVRVDGKTFKYHDEELKDILDRCVDKVIMYSQNTKGDISFIDTPLDIDENGINTLRSVSNANLQYTTTNHSIGGKAFLNEDSVIFIVPNNGDLLSYTACNLTKYESIDSRYDQVRNNLTVYTYGVDTIDASVMVCKTDCTGAWLDSMNAFYFVEKITMAINEDDEPCYELTLWREGKTQTMYTENLDTLNVKLNGVSYTVSKGDCIYFGCNKKGNITKGLNGDQVKVLYSGDRGVYNGNAPHYVFSENYYVSKNNKHGWVYDTTNKDKYYWFSTKEPSLVTDVITDESLHVYKLGDIPNVIVYDAETGEVEEGSADIFKTYKIYGGGCSELVFYMNGVNETSGSCVIYK